VVFECRIRVDREVRVRIEAKAEDNRPPPGDRPEAKSREWADARKIAHCAIAAGRS